MEKVEKLREGLKSEDYSVRRYAAEELGRLGAKEAVSELIQLLGDPSWDVRKAAASTLGNLGEKETAASLLPLLADVDWFVRETAAISLGKLGDKSVAPALEKCLKDEVYSVRKAAHSALRILGVEVKKEAAAAMMKGSAEKHEVKKTEERIAQREEESTRSRIVSVVQEVEAILTTMEDGFDIQVEVGKGREQKVEVRFEQDQIVYRSSCGAATSENYLWALKTNYTMEYGSLAVVDIDAQPSFVAVERQLERSADREEIRKAIWGIATFADWVEEALTSEDKR